MSELVIDALQVVQVEHGQGKRMPVPGGVGGVPVQLLLEGSMVAEPRDRVEQCIQSCL